MVLDDVFFCHQLEARLAIRTREGEHVIKLPSGTKVLVIHNSDIEACPPRVQLEQQLFLARSIDDYIRWSRNFIYFLFFLLLKISIVVSVWLFRFLSFLF